MDGWCWIRIQWQSVFKFSWLIFSLLLIELQLFLRYSPAASNTALSPSSAWAMNLSYVPQPIRLMHHQCHKVVSPCNRRCSLYCREVNLMYHTAPILHWLIIIIIIAFAWIKGWVHFCTACINYGTNCAVMFWGIAHLVTWMLHVTLSLSGMLMSSTTT